jgi:hypothetical protein
VIDLSILKPAVPKRALLFVAALLWTFAGSMLLFKGYKMLDQEVSYLWIKLTVTFLAGLAFYWKVFSGLSQKHTLRILNMKVDYPCVFAFFNVRSYLMMALMISMGITLRKTGWVSPSYLAYLYLTMSVPLMLSSVRFYYTGFFYSRFKVVVIPGNREPESGEAG